MKDKLRFGYYHYLQKPDGSYLQVLQPGLEKISDLPVKVGIKSYQIIGYTSDVLMHLEKHATTQVIAQGIGKDGFWSDGANGATVCIKVSPVAKSATEEMVDVVRSGPLVSFAMPSIFGLVLDLYGFIGGEKIIDEAVLRTSLSTRSTLERVVQDTQIKVEIVNYMPNKTSKYKVGTRIDTKQGAITFRDVSEVVAHGKMKKKNARKHVSHTNKKIERQKTNKFNVQHLENANEILKIATGHNRKKFRAALKETPQILLYRTADKQSAILEAAAKSKDPNFLFLAYAYRDPAHDPLTPETHAVYLEKHGGVPQDFNEFKHHMQKNIPCIIELVNKVNDLNMQRNAIYQFMDYSRAAMVALNEDDDMLARLERSFNYNKERIHKIKKFRIAFENYESDTQDIMEILEKLDNLIPEEAEKRWNIFYHERFYMALTLNDFDAASIILANVTERSASYEKMHIDLGCAYLGNYMNLMYDLGGQAASHKREQQKHQLFEYALEHFLKANRVDLFISVQFSKAKIDSKNFHRLIRKDLANLKKLLKGIKASYSILEKQKTSTLSNQKKLKLMELKIESLERTIERLEAFNKKVPQDKISLTRIGEYYHLINRQKKKHQSLLKRHKLPAKDTISRTLEKKSTLTRNYLISEVRATHQQAVINSLR